MRHLGLFEGVGGFALAAKLMGWQTVAWVEKDEECQRVLKKNFPESKAYADILEFSGQEFTGNIEIVTGGFPCQPFSSAGERSGTDDERYLWPEMLRVLRKVQPRWVVAENVYGLLTIDNGFTVESICADLENSGFQTPVILDTASDAFGLPTLERHIWIISEANGKRLQRREKDQDSNENERQFQGTNSGIPNRWDISATEFRGVDKRVSQRLDKAGKHRVQQLGNAIPPLIAYQIFRTIERFESTTK